MRGVKKQVDGKGLVEKYYELEAKRKVIQSDELLKEVRTMIPAELRAEIRRLIPEVLWPAWLID